jgi:hypothetical protein
VSATAPHRTEVFIVLSPAEAAQNVP